MRSENLNSAFHSNLNRYNNDSRVSLDIIQPNSNNSESSPTIPLCRASRFILSGSKNEDGLFPHLKVFCKTYGCPFCGPKKVYIVQKAIEAAIGTHSLNVFATLTLDPKRLANKDQSESAKYIRKVWNKFRKWSRPSPRAL
jgi:hypothetical protein